MIGYLESIGLVVSYVKVNISLALAGMLQTDETESLSPHLSTFLPDLNSILKI